jgi:hypothetical protein
LPRICSKFFRTGVFARRGGRSRGRRGGSKEGSRLSMGNVTSLCSNLREYVPLRVHVLAGHRKRTDGADAEYFCSFHVEQAHHKRIRLFHIPHLNLRKIAKSISNATTITKLLSLFDIRSLLSLCSYYSFYSRLPLFDHCCSKNEIVCSANIRDGSAIMPAIPIHEQIENANI